MNSHKNGARLGRAPRLSSRRSFGLIILTLLLAGSAHAQQTAAPAATQAPAQKPALRASITDYKHMGVASCSTSVCHGKLAPAPGKNVRLNEYRTWVNEDRHADAYRTLEQKESKRIASNMGLPNAATAKICLDCHADNMPADKRGPKFQLSDGVQCEACHGGSERWLESHAGESATHKDNLARGMYPSESPLERAELCLSCHLGTKDRFATHEIMAAGHPRLQFELEGFTATQPAHFTVDADYEGRKGKIENVNLWVTGQIENARTMLRLLQSPMYATSTMFPELAFYDCDACHHSMENVRWNPERASMGIKPGTLRLQTHSLLIVQAIVGSFDPEATKELVQLTNALVRAGREDRGAVGTAAKNLLAWINQRTDLARRKYSRAEIVNLRRSLVKFGASERGADYLTAYQIYTGVDSLSITLGDRDSKEASLDALFKIIDKPYTFSPNKFMGTAKNLQNNF
jgi:hypothetical protein